MLELKSYPTQLTKQSEHYTELLEDVFDYLESGTEFFKDLFVLAKDNYDYLIPYTPVNFFWIYETSNLITLFELTNEIKNHHNLESRLTEEQEMVFDEWQKSDFAESFMSSIQNKTSIYLASLIELPKYLSQLTSLFKVHILHEKKIPLTYILNKELGDHIHDNNNVIYNIDEEIVEFEECKFAFLTSDYNNKKLHLENIKNALEKIKLCSPHSYQRFFYFTNAIIPHDNSEVVSYSIQHLPGFSIMNLYNRDPIDLMDDLLHENGHHHLNTYLNTDELINEDSELIYYSPWRAELRPIRGIYHGFCTFCWAFILFRDLNTNINKVQFSEIEKEKIKFRLLEEYLMLSYSIPDLDHAFKIKQITKSGKEVADELIHELKKFNQQQYDSIFAELSPSSQTQITELRELLKTKRMEFTLT